jgi:glycosyltransferase involved in cell wall biosynthesis
MAERVLHVVNGDEYGGSERVQDLLAAHLPAHGFEVGFACVKPGEVTEDRSRGPWPLHVLPMRSRADWGIVPELARILRQGRYALVHTHTPRAAMVGRPAAARALGVPMVHHVHGSTLAVWPGRIRNLVTTATERLSLVRVGGVIVVSRDMAREIRRLGVPARRIFLAPNGVPGPATLPERARPSGEWTIGTLARLRPGKGLEPLLEALALLRADGVPARLRVAGAFETEAYEATVRGTMRRLGLEPIVEWRGFRADVAAELRAMDLFVLPSLTEGLPMSLLEAMAAGVPVVASRVGGVPEVLRPGIDGLLVPPGDPPALAAAVARVVRGEVDWGALREAAHQRQRSRFSERAMAARVAWVYRRVLAARAGRGRRCS